ncbi:MAG: dihydrofolate reductase [Muribaculaceae bacterium]|nr:dihydrofolate reductase [Muribaculaceae bacterium]
MKKEICAIVAMGDDREIGYENKLIWRISEDLKRFKALTMGHPIVMGRKTFESLPKPLPGRTNIVITRNPDYTPEGCVIAHSIEEALELAANSEGGDKIFIIGGGEIYKQAFPLLNRLEITHIHENSDADTFFPQVTMQEWTLTDQSDIKETLDGINYTFESYKRI